MRRMFRRKKFRLRLRSRALPLGERTLIMGILNVTPDSFSDGGQFIDFHAAAEHAIAMARDGADIIDIGAESTRPGSTGTSAEEERRRILPVLEALRRKKFPIPISIDTRKSQVAEAALQAGAEIINDVSGLRFDPQVASIAARYKAGLVLMHMRGEPETMQKMPFARNVMDDVTEGLKKSLFTAFAAGVSKDRIIIDPGFGFGKSDRQNFELLAKLQNFAKLGYPILAGTSRKGFVGRALGEKVRASERMWGTAATVAASILRGAHIVRVHEVREMAQVARAADAILKGSH